METVTISTIKTVEETTGKYGPQMRIVFEDSLGRTISGWIPRPAFKNTEWIAGANLKLEISQNGKYTNFKWPSKKKEENEEIMKALRLIYQEVMSISRRLSTTKTMPEYPDDPDAFGDTR